MKFIHNEEGVSPVIGVILMVAITVILAGIIAAFVFGHAGNVEKTKIIETRVIQKNETHAELTFVGGPDAAFVKTLNLTLTSSVGTSTATLPNPKVGNTVAVGSATNGQDHVIAVATFKDGSQQVVFDGYV